MQIQEHSTAEYGLLRGDLDELRGELNNLITRIYLVEESVSTKISVVEEVMSNKYLKQKNCSNSKKFSHNYKKVKFKYERAYYE